MRKSNYVLLGLFLFQICSFSQSQDFNNGNLENVNAIWINDPGPEEGIKWLGTSSNWNIDVSPEDRTNADGNLNIYGTSNRIVLWRPTVIKGDISYLFLSSNDAPDGNRNWYHAVGNDGSYVLNITNDNYQWTKSILKVKRNGNLGIGVSDPMTKLSIYGSIAEGWNSGIELNREGGGKGWIVVDGDGMKLRTPNNGDGFYFRDNDNQTSLFIQDGGNIGVGTRFPNEKLAIGNGNLEFETATNSKHLWGEEIQTIDFAYRRDDAPQAKIARIALKNYNTDGTGWYYFTDRYDAGLSFYTCNNNVLSERMTLTHEGNVGIGTTSPYYKLDVEGTIRAHEIKVNLDEGADFVFEEDYNLMPLNELESFVKTQKHLPEVAPAKEMEAEGLNISEMNIKLLQKIEELTLYIIDLQKQVDDLKGQLDKQE